MQAQEILAGYLSEIARVRGTGAGTGETSYYGALQNAFNAVGGQLRPKVFCMPQLANQRGAGLPDFGLFAASQIARGTPLEWASGALPERGVVEADDIPASLSVKRGSAQVARFLASYGLVLITNYRDFELLRRAADGIVRPMESFSFDRAPPAFFSWAAARHGTDLERKPSDLNHWGFPDAGEM